MIEKKYKIPLYSGELIISSFKNIKDAELKYGLENVDGMDAFTFKKLNEKGVRDFYMVFDENPKIPYIAHEAVHITNMVFDNSCIELDIVNDEPYAYFLEWVVQTCLIFFKTQE